MIIHRSLYFLLFAGTLTAIVINSGCTKVNDEEDVCPYPPHPSFTSLPENNAGSRIRTVTYVYDRTAIDVSYPPKIDSSTILFSYDITGKIDSLRLIQNDSFVIYDFAFERHNNRLTAIHAHGWTTDCSPEQVTVDLELQYDGSGKVSLLKTFYPVDPTIKSDSFIIKSTNNRIDTVIDRRFAVGNNVEKYAFKYNGSGDITQMEQIQIQGIYFIIEDVFKYTLSGNPAPLVWGDEGIFWYFFAKYCDISSLTDFMIPPVLFHSTKQPSKLDAQILGSTICKSEYQMDYYNSGRLKKMTASVITSTGAFYAREAYYYTYCQ